MTKKSETWDMRIVMLYAGNIIAGVIVWALFGIWGWIVGVHIGLVVAYVFTKLSSGRNVFRRYTNENKEFN